MTTQLVESDLISVKEVSDKFPLAKPKLSDVLESYPREKLASGHFFHPDGTMCAIGVALYGTDEKCEFGNLTEWMKKKWGMNREQMNHIILIFDTLSGRLGMEVAVQGCVAKLREWGL